MTAFAQDISVIKKPRLISLQSFLKRYSDIEDGYKYEYNNGIIEKTKTMNQDQSTIEDALLRAFIETNFFRQGGAIFFEKEIYTTATQLRKPDAAIFTANQKRVMGRDNMQVPIWVAEVISETDNINRVNKKLVEYFEAGVKVVWHIFPNIETVYVYTAADVVTICKGAKICSGAPAVADFEISATNLFAKN
jgi:Uma2 family endonuclease